MTGVCYRQIHRATQDASSAASCLGLTIQKTVSSGWGAIILAHVDWQTYAGRPQGAMPEGARGNIAQCTEGMLYTVHPEGASKQMLASPP